MARTAARERVLIVGVSPKGIPRAVAEDHLDELERLVDTAGGDVLARFVKERIAPDPKTYIGKGAVEQIGTAIRTE
ncbi:MAG TPA: GTPase HflX, partial [Thermoanaerobaculia bacterium]